MEKLLIKKLRKKIKIFLNYIMKLVNSLKKMMKNTMKCLENNKELFFMLLVLFFVLFLFKNNIKENLENEKNGNKLVYYYWDKCGHCKTFTPEWDSFVDSYDGPLECSKLEQKEAKSAGDLKKYEIRGFPSVLLLDNNGEKIGEFNGERTVDGLNDYVNNL